MPLSRETVKGMVGENRLLPDELLPDNVAVDGRNADYSKGTIARRKGSTKTHAFSVKTGGVLIDNSASNNKCILIRHSSVLDLVGDFTVEIIVEPMTNPVSLTNPAMLVVKSAGSNGWWMSYSNSSQVWQFRKYDSGGTSRTITVNGDVGTGDYRINEKYHVAAWRTGTTMQMRVTRMSDGTVSSSSTITCSGDTTNSNDIFVGARFATTPNAQISSWKVDELRIWSDVRTTAEMDAAKYRELNDTERLDTNLIGYWPMNDDALTIVEDKSINKNHGNMNASGPSFVPGLVPTGTDDDYALRGDGYDDYAEGAYSTAYAPILNTGNEWVVEFWARLDSSITPSGTQTIISLGNYASTGAGQRGAVFSIEMTTAGLLQYRHSSTTTDQNTLRTLSTAYTFTPGVPVHIALQRKSSQIQVFINGVAYDTNTVTTENGPSTSTSYGMEFLCINTGGTRSQFAQFTIDEVRLWVGTRNRPQIQNWYTRELVDAEQSGLVGYWRFNAGDKELDETGNVANFSTGPTSDAPEYSNGLVSNSEPMRNILMIAPMARTIRTDEINTGVALFDRENLICTRHAMFSQAKTNLRFLRNLDVPGSDNLYSWCNFNGFVVFGNGVGRNYAYNGRNLPYSLTFPTFPNNTITCTPAAASATFPATGRYYYKFSWYDGNRGIEGGLSSFSGLFGYAYGDITATTQNIGISGLPSSLTGYPEVTHIRIYRLDVGATYYRYVSAVAIGTTTYTDTGTNITLAAQEPSYTRLDLSPCNVFCTHQNRIFAARGSDIYFSEADSMDFASTSTFGVDSDDGDTITGMRSAFGGLIIFKKNSLHFLDGDGPTSFTVRKLVDGIGCVSQASIASGVGGVYFLGADGVYVWNGNSIPRYISHSQQPLFSRIDHTKANLAVGAYHPETHQYLCSLDLVAESTTSETNSDSATKLPANAVDDATLTSLFTHYYKLDTTAADSKGTGGTVSDADFDVSTSDAQRGLVAYSNGSPATWDTTMTAQSAVSSDFTVGFWRKFPTDSSGVSLSPYPFITFGRYVAGSYSTILKFRVDNAGTFLAQTNSIMYVDLDGTTLFRYVLTSTDWYNISLKKSGTTYTLYINGEAVGSVSGSNPSVVFDGWGVDASLGDQPINVYLDNIFWVRNSALTSDQIYAIYDYERAGPAVSVLSADDEEGATESLTMCYDEETDSWARWTGRYSALVLAEYTQRTNEILAGYNGFVVRLLEGTSDAFAIDDVTGAFTRSGTLTAVTGATITDASASLPTTGDGLNGCEVWCVPSDTSLSIQVKRVLYNTATTMVLDSDLDLITGTYYLGPIQLMWESRWMDGGDPFLTKVCKYLSLWTEENSNVTITVKYKTDRDETWSALTFTTSDEFSRFTLSMRGRKLKLRFENVQSSYFTEIKSFMPELMAAGSVP